MSYPPPPEGEQPDSDRPPPYPYDPNQPAYGQQPYGYGQPQYGYPSPQGHAPGYANWLYRVGGYLVDQAVALPGYVLIGVSGALVDAQGNPTPTGLGLNIAGVVVALAIFVWNTVVRQGRSGWSVGKQALGIRLIGEQTGQPIGAGMSFVRQITHILDSLACYIGWLWPLWDRKRQTFADKIVSTVVVHQRRQPDAQVGSPAT